MKLLTVADKLENSARMQLVVVLKMRPSFNCLQPMNSEHRDSDSFRVSTYPNVMEREPNDTLRDEANSVDVGSSRPVHRSLSTESFKVRRYRYFPFQATKVNL